MQSPRAGTVSDREVPESHVQHLNAILESHFLLGATPPLGICRSEGVDDRFLSLALVSIP